MNKAGSIQPRQSKNERREAAREKARALREEAQKKDKRRRLLWQGGSIVAVLALVAVIFWGFQGWQDQQAAASVGPKNMISDGFLIAPGGAPVETAAIPAGGAPVPTTPDSSGTVANIVVYVDYMCPFCGYFEQTNGQLIQTLVNEGGASYEIHPVAILTAASAGTKYSLRAANAFACVANYSPNAALPFNDLLFANQPEEGGPGLDDATLKAIAAEAGVDDVTQVNSCIDDQQFKNWVTAATDRATADPLLRDEQDRFTTPRVMVNGQMYNGSPYSSEEFLAFVTQATSASYNDSTATPSP